MDVSPYLELKIAPRAVFDSLEQRRARPRFMIPGKNGDWQAVTWGAFAEQISRIALFLEAVGLTSTERAAIYAPNRVEWLSAAYGIQAAGGVMVPIYPASTADQAGYVIEHSAAKVLFVDTAPLLANVFQAWADCAAVERIVLLDDGLDAFAVLAEVRERFEGALPRPSDLEPKLIKLSRALELGAAREHENPEAFRDQFEAMYG